MKVLWLLDELALPFERIDAGLAFGQVDTDAFRAMNPFGLVPVLRDGGTALFESNTILRYICNAYAGGGPLYPAAPPARAEIEAWMDAQLATSAPMGIVFHQLVRATPAQRDDAALAHALERSAALFRILDTRLASRAFLAGDTLTLADMAFGPLVHRWHALPLARPDMRALRAYYRRLLARPAYLLRCAARLS